MLLQTNSYIVPKEKRAEHTRLVRRFRHTLARLGCEHFEVYEQVGANWTGGDSGGRFVQIIRFRDRQHQIAVQAAERSDPDAQNLIAEFCDLINLPYQQQQGLFAMGYYHSVLPVTAPRVRVQDDLSADDEITAEAADVVVAPIEDEVSEEGYEAEAFAEEPLGEIAVEEDPVAEATAEEPAADAEADHGLDWADELSALESPALDVRRASPPAKYGAEPSAHATELVETHEPADLELDLPPAALAEHPAAFEEEALVAPALAADDLIGDSEVEDALDEALGHEEPAEHHAGELSALAEHPAEDPEHAAELGQFELTPGEIEQHEHELSATEPAETELTEDELAEEAAAEELPAEEELTGEELAAQAEAPGEEALGEEEAVAEDEALAEEEALGEEELLGHEEALAGDEALSEEEVLGEEQALGDEELPSDEEALSEGESLGEGEVLSEEEALSEEHALTEEGALAEDQALSEEEALAEEEALSDEEAHAGEEEQSEHEALSEEEAAEEEVAGEEALSEEEALGEEEAVGEEPAEVEAVEAGLEEEFAGEEEFQPEALDLDAEGEEHEHTEIAPGHEDHLADTAGLDMSRQPFVDMLSETAVEAPAMGSDGAHEPMAASPGTNGHGAASAHEGQNGDADFFSDAEIDDALNEALKELDEFDGSSVAGKPR